MITLTASPTSAPSGMQIPKRDLLKKNSVSLKVVPLNVFMCGAFKEIGYGDLQRSGQLLKAAHAKAVGAPLVFLNLLERHTEDVSHLCLVNAQGQAERTQSKPYVGVHGGHTAFAW